MSGRFQRILAFIIDWSILCVPFLGVMIVLVSMMWKQSSVSPLPACLCFLAVIAATVLLVLRDFIFRGSSPGKRIFGLHVYDKKTLGDSSPSQRATRNLFFTLLPVEGVILLATGETIGDRAAGTLVLSQNSLEALRSAPPTVPVPHRKADLKVLIPVIAFALIGVLFFVGTIQFMLNSRKDTEEYRMAYIYLITSDSFLHMDVEETDIRLNQYHSSSFYSADSDTKTQTVEFGFLVHFRSFVVVCHQEDGLWRVCDECTAFD